MTITAAERHAAVANALSRYRWTVLARGVLWVFVGIIFFTRPGTSTGSLVLVLGAAMLLDGMSNVVGTDGMRQRSESRWAGLVGIVIGVLAFRFRSTSETELLFYLACWGILVGALEIVAAVRLRREIEGDWWFVLAGVVSLTLGVLLLVRFIAGGRSALPLIGAFSIAFGVSLIVLAVGAHAYVKRFASSRQ